MSQTFLWYWAKKNVLTYSHNQTKISGFSESPQKAFLFLPLYIIFSGLGAKPLLTGKGAEEKGSGVILCIKEVHVQMMFTSTFKIIS